jgi:hypothetical protein
MVFAAGLALFALYEVGLDAYALATYTFVPLLACPLGAYLIARDREHGLSAVAATTPVDPTSLLLGRLTALSTLLVGGLALTLPVLYALTETVAPGAFRAALPLVGWGLLVGLVSLLVGSIVGYAKTGPSTGALSVGFGIVVAWVVIAVQRHRFLAWADSETELAVIQAILHANPLTWALEAEHPAAVGVVANHSETAAGLALLLVPLALALGAVALGLQHMDGWLEQPLQHPAALALLAASVLGAGVFLATWDYARPTPPTEVPSDAQSGQAGNLTVRLEADPKAPWKGATPIGVTLTLVGPPNATVTLEELVLSGPNLTVNHQLQVPKNIQLDEIRTDRGHHATENETHGTGELKLQANATPQRVASLVPLAATVTVAGNETTLTTTLEGSVWGTPIVPPLAAAGVPLAVLAWTAWKAPRRWNRW